MDATKKQSSQHMADGLGWEEQQFQEEMLTGLQTDLIRNQMQNEFNYICHCPAG